MSMDELAVMDGGKCLLQVRGVRPFLSRKYDITKHPNYKYLSDFNPKNTFDIEKYLSTRLRVRPDDLFLNYEISPSELAEEFRRRYRIGPPIRKILFLFGGPCFFMPISRRCLLVRSRDSPKFTHNPQDVRLRSPPAVCSFFKQRAAFFAFRPKTATTLSFFI